MGQTTGENRSAWCLSLPKPIGYTLLIYYLAHYSVPITVFGFLGPCHHFSTTPRIPALQGHQSPHKACPGSTPIFISGVSHDIFHRQMLYSVPYRGWPCRQVTPAESEALPFGFPLTPGPKSLFIPPVFHEPQNASWLIFMWLRRWHGCMSEIGFSDGSFHEYDLKVAAGTIIRQLWRNIMNSRQPNCHSTSKKHE